jgi:hypothetical protein
MDLDNYTDTFNFTGYPYPAGFPNSTQNATIWNPDPDVAGPGVSPNESHPQFFSLHSS